MKNNLKIAIIGAMDCEVSKLSDLLDTPKTTKTGKLKINTGKIGNHTVIIAKSGVGKVNAALNTQYIIDTFNPDCIINTGIAGGISPDLSVGDIVIGTELVQHDFDASALGYAKGYMCTGINPSEPTIYYSDKNLINDFEKALSKIEKNYKIHKGVIATGDMFIANTEKKKELRTIFNATAAEMEGAAIAQTATVNSVPFVIIRAISDLADCSAPKSLDEVETQMAEFASTTIETMLTNL